MWLKTHFGVSWNVDERASLRTSVDHNFDDDYRQQESRFGTEWPSLFPFPPPSFSLQTLRKGYLNYTKYQYGQKKLNKNWNKAYVSLISNWLLFYANEKKAKEAKNQPYGKPEFRIDLIGGKVEDGKEKTRRHNALLVTAFTPGSNMQACACERWYAVVTGVVEVVTRRG